MFQTRGNFTRQHTARDTGFGAPRRGTRRVPHHNLGKTHKLSAELFALSRIYLTILRCLGHLRILEEGVPKNLSTKARELVEYIRPAFPSEEFKEEMSAIGEMWSNAVVSTLRAHYHDTAQSHLLKLCDFSHPRPECEYVFRVSKSWFRDRHKFNEAFFDFTLDLILSYHPGIEKPPPRPHESTEPNSPMSIDFRSPPEVRHERKGRILIQVPSPKSVTTATDDVIVTPLNDSPKPLERDICNPGVITEQRGTNNNTITKTHETQTSLSGPHLAECGTTSGSAVPALLSSSSPTHIHTEQRRKRNLSLRSSDLDNPGPHISRRTDTLATPRRVSTATHSHPDTRFKYKEWHLNLHSGDEPQGKHSIGPHVRKLFIGDESLNNFPYTDEETSIQIFPNCSFEHLAAILYDCPTFHRVTTLFISVGVHSRRQDFQRTCVRSLKRVLGLILRKFPNLKKLSIPCVPMLNRFKGVEKQNLISLNDFLLHKVDVPSFINIESFSEIEEFLDNSFEGSMWEKVFKFWDNTFHFL